MATKYYPLDIVASALIVFLLVICSDLMHFLLGRPFHTEDVPRRRRSSAANTGGELIITTAKPLERETLMGNMRETTGNRGYIRKTRDTRE